MEAMGRVERELEEDSRVWPRLRHHTLQLRHHTLQLQVLQHPQLRRAPTMMPLQLEDPRAFSPIITVDHLARVTEGVVAMITTNERSLTLRWFNLHTRCEIGSELLDGCMPPYSLVVLDAETVAVVGAKYQSHRTFNLAAVICRSGDGFGTRRSTVVWLVNELNVVNEPGRFVLIVGSCEFCLDMAGQLVFGISRQHEAPSLRVFRVPRAQLLQLASGTGGLPLTRDTRLPTAPFGEIPLHPMERLAALACGDGTLALLRGKSPMDADRIEFYDIENFGLLRVVFVDYPVLPTFPPPRVDAVRRSGKPVALLQTVLGTKLCLDLESGAIQRMRPFASPNQSSFAAILEPGSKYTEEEFDVIAQYVTLHEGYMAAPTDDAVIFWGGRSLVDNVLMGGFAEHVLRNEQAPAPPMNRGSVTILRTPLDRVHKLSTLATDAVNAQLSRDIRMRITKDANPLRSCDFVAAILDASSAPSLL